MNINNSTINENAADDGSVLYAQLNIDPQGNFDAEFRSLRITNSTLEGNNSK